jgi:hypothetical protein
MTRLSGIASTLLIAFVATTAVPGSGVVTHHHEGGDHEHVHAFFGFDHDDHDHRRHAHRPARRTHDHARLPRIARDHHDPLSHTHVVSPFRPATAASPATLDAATVVTTEPASAPDAPALRAVATIRSRGPPAPPLV